MKGFVNFAVSTFSRNSLKLVIAIKCVVVLMYGDKIYVVKGYFVVVTRREF